jgi:hypothetical protein
MEPTLENVRREYKAYIALAKARGFNPPGFFGRGPGFSSPFLAAHREMFYSSLPGDDELFDVLSDFNIQERDIDALERYMTGEGYSPEMKRAVYEYVLQVLRRVKDDLAEPEAGVEDPGLPGGRRRKSTGVSGRRKKTRKARSRRSRNTGSRTLRR